jgi:thiamine-phosphate pyrophosphorylase
MQKCIPKIYCFINSFNKDYISSLNKNIAIIYRNYEDKINPSLILNIKNFCKKSSRKFYLSNNIKLSLKLDLDGVYLPSFNNDYKINIFQKKKKFLVLGSAHNIKEIREKELQNVNAIFISPIFKNQKSRYYLGINRTNLMTQLTQKKVIGLGGFNEKNIIKIKLLNIYGIASISLFKKKKYINF